MLYPILINEIKISKKTQKLTKTSSIEELKKVAPTLFSGYSDAQLMATIEDIYNGKLGSSHRIEIQGYSTEQKRQHALDQLTFQLELSQEMPKTTDPNAPKSQVQFFLRSRLNVANQVSTKKFWQTTNFEGILAYDWKKGDNFSEKMQKEGNLVYLFRENSFTPRLNEDKTLVVSAPKRMGEGGDYLLKDNKLIFLNTHLVMNAFDSLEDYNETITKLQEAEQANVELFKHNSVIDVVENNIPAEIRDADTGGFATDYQEWLHEYLYKSTGMQVGITASESVAA